MATDTRLGVLRRRPSRTLLEATFDPALHQAIVAFGPFAYRHQLVLIGSLALNFYAKPRFAVSAEFLVSDLPDRLITGFHGTSRATFVHEKTGSTILLLAADRITLPPWAVERMTVTAIQRDGLRIASRESMVAFNLYSTSDQRWRSQRLADVVSILSEHDADMTDWGLSTAHLELLRYCRTCAGTPNQKAIENSLAELELDL